MTTAVSNAATAEAEPPRAASPESRPQSAPVVLILGGTSAIARGIAAAFARRGYSVVLAGREQDELERSARDLTIRFGTPARAVAFDAGQHASHGALMEALARDGSPSGVVAAFGMLGDQGRARADFEHARAILDANFLGLVSILTHAANALEERGSGFIIGISSVAGERGRQSNYVYGAAKAGASAFLQGLRNRLAPAGVHVMTVKPGFVDTRMTWGLPGLFLVADPNEAGENIVRAVERRRDVVYVRGIWRWIMLVIRSIPETVFKRLKL